MFGVGCRSRTHRTVAHRSGGAGRQHISASPPPGRPGQGRGSGPVRDLTPPRDPGRPCRPGTASPRRRRVVGHDRVMTNDADDAARNRAARAGGEQAGGGGRAGGGAGGGQGSGPARRGGVVDRRPGRGAGPADGAVDHPVPAGEPAVTDLGGGPGRGRPGAVRTHHHRPGGLAVGPGGVAAGTPAAADGRAETRPLGHLHPDTAVPAPGRASAAAGSAPRTRHPTGRTRRTPPGSGPEQPGTTSTVQQCGPVAGGVRTGVGRPRRRFCRRG